MEKSEMAVTIMARLHSMRRNVFLLMPLALAGCLGGSQIGGTISGLSADGLVLANGSVTVSPPANATSFVFPGLLNQGASYSFYVTVQTQPNGLYCSIANGVASGVVGPAPLPKVAVTCLPAPFKDLIGIAADAAGNLYVADASNNNVSKVAPDNSVSLVGTLAVAAGNYLEDIKSDAAGDVYVYDVGTNAGSIRQISPSGAVTTLTSDPARFHVPGSIIPPGPGSFTMDLTGHLYETVPIPHCVQTQISPLGASCTSYTVSGSRVVKVTPDGIRTTLVEGGSGNAWQGIVSDAAGNLYVNSANATAGGPADNISVVYSNPSIQKITPDGVVTPLTVGLADSITGRTIAIDDSSNLYVISTSSSGDVSILKITQAGVVTAIADFNGTAPIKLPAVPVAIVFVAPNTLALASAYSVFRMTLPQ
jgi:sugar lactone lactonase YvrE